MKPVLIDANQLSRWASIWGLPIAFTGLCNAPWMSSLSAFQLRLGATVNDREDALQNFTMKVVTVAHGLVGWKGMTESTYDRGINSWVKSTRFHAGCGSSFRPVTKAWAQRRSLRQRCQQFSPPRGITKSRACMR